MHVQTSDPIRHIYMLYNTKNFFKKEKLLMVENEPHKPLCMTYSFFLIPQFCSVQQGGTVPSQNPPYCEYKPVFSVEHSCYGDWQQIVKEHIFKITF